MADLNEKHTENVPGPFFTDSNCIICEMCIDIAPAMFKATEDNDHAYVYRQPTTEEEKELALEALECCPVEAIGDHGESSLNAPHLMNKA